jgi:hypothetical protein
MKLEDAMLRMNAGYIIQCAAIGSGLMNSGGANVDRKSTGPSVARQQDLSEKS